MSATRVHQTIWVLLATGLAIAALWLMTGVGARGGPAFATDETSGGRHAQFEHYVYVPYGSERRDAGITFVADPVIIGTGELRHQETDLEVPSLGIPFRFTRVYRSSLSYNGPLGKQWDFNYNTHLEVSGSIAYLYDGSGRSEAFTAGNGTDYYPTDSSRFEKLLNVSTTTVTTITRELASPRLKYLYENDGGDLTKFRLKEITNEFGHSMTFGYDADTGRLNAITDTEGGAYAITYNANGYIDTLTDFDERSITYTYDGPTGNLIEVEEDCGTTTRTTKYTYKNGTSLLETAKSPEQVALANAGVPYLTNSYDDNTFRVTKQTSGDGDYEFTYPNIGSSPVELLDRNGNKRVYHFDSSGRTTSIVVHGDTDTFVTEYTYHSDGQIDEIRHPKSGGYGRVDKFTYDTSDDPIEKSRLLERELIPAVGGNTTPSLVWTFGSYDSTFNIPLSTTDANGLETSVAITGTKPAFTFTTTVGASGGTQSENAATYDSEGRLDTIVRKVTGTKNEETKFYYATTTTGLVSSIAAKVGTSYELVQSFTYDDRRNLYTRTDSRGKTTTYNHNGRNNLTSIEYPGSTYTMSLTYNKDDRVKTRTVPVQPSVTRTETITRDLLGNPKTVTIQIDGSNDATSTTEYDDGERVEKTTDADGREVKYFWNDRDLIKQITFAPGTTEEAKVYYTYDHEGRLTTFTDGRNKLWKTKYDVYGRVLRRIDADGHYLEYTYGNGGLTPTSTVGTVVEETKFYASDGTTVHRHTKYDFDELLRIEKREAMAKLSPTGGNIGDGWQTNTYEYDLTGRTTKIFDDRNKYVQFVYDDLGRLTTRVHETGNKVEFDYVDQTGLVEKRTLYENVPGTTQKQSIDTYTYDDLGRRLLHTDPGSNVSSVAYNFAGQVVTHKDPLGNLVNHTYDRRGARLNTVIQEANLTTVQAVSFAYYDSGLLKEATDGLNKVTKYAYDNRGRLKERQYQPDGSEYLWVYDDAGNLTTLTDPRGTVFSYDYNDRGLLLTIGISAGAGSNLYGDSDDVVYVYNAVGEVTEISDKDSIVEFSYTTLGQVRREKQIISEEAMPTEWGRTVTSTYDDAGRREAVTYPIPGSVTADDFQLDYSYDDLYRLTGLKRTFGGAQTTLATYTYAGFDRLTRADYKGNNTKMLLTHDARNMVTTLLHADASDNKLFEINRVFDPAGRTSWRRQQYFGPNSTPYYSDVAHYDYDAASRMSVAYHGMPAATWGTGGPAWNATPTNYASAKLYQLTAVDTRSTVTAWYSGPGYVTEGYSAHATSGTHDYVSATIDGLNHVMTNDLSGNRTEHDIGSTDNAVYGYDAFNRLVYAKTDISGGFVTTVTWRHDALGRTIEEKVVDGSTKVTRYYHDGSSRVLEVDIADEQVYDGETKVRTYVYGAEGPAPFFGRKEEGNDGLERYFHADERGSVLGLTDASTPTVTEHFRYQKVVGTFSEARDYGEFTLHTTTSATVRTNSTGTGIFGNPFLWTGSPMSHGLYNATAARTLFVEHGAAYDPVTGIGLQRGGAGGAFAGGSHTAPTATPATWGAGSGGGVAGAGDGRGWRGTGIRSGAWRPSRRADIRSDVSRRNMLRWIPITIRLERWVETQEQVPGKCGGIRIIGRFEYAFFRVLVPSTIWNPGSEGDELNEHIAFLAAMRYALSALRDSAGPGWMEAWREQYDYYDQQWKIGKAIQSADGILGQKWDKNIDILEKLFLRGDVRAGSVEDGTGGHSTLDRVAGLSDGDSITIDWAQFDGEFAIDRLAAILVHESVHVANQLEITFQKGAMYMPSGMSRKRWVAMSAAGRHAVLEEEPHKATAVFLKKVMKKHRVSDKPRNLAASEFLKLMEDSMADLNQAASTFRRYPAVERWVRMGRRIEGWVNGWYKRR